ncbi:MAG: hypothetical protein AAGH82_10650 [Pseudomonadota bacterium]
MFEHTPKNTQSDFAANSVSIDGQESGQLRWLVNVATIVMLGVAAVTLTACDGGGTGTEQAAPPADDTTTTQ